MNSCQFNQDHYYSKRDRYLHCGPFTLDLQTQQTLLEENNIPLPTCTFNYLVTLARHSPKPVSFKQLVEDAQGYSLPALEAQDLARFRIYMLRKALEKNIQAPQYILSVPGFGYRLSVSR